MSSRSLSQVDLLLERSRGVVQHPVHHTRDGEDPAHNGTDPREEVREGVPVLGQLDHHGGEVVEEEDSRQPLLSCHGPGQLLVPGH